MTSPFRLDIVLPETPMPSRTVTAINVPASDGRLTVLAHHQPLIATLNAGTMTVVDENELEESWTISAGALQVEDNVATLLVREATQQAGGKPHENNTQ